jgi:hypothetical protein
MCIIEPMDLRGVDLKLLVSLYIALASYKSLWSESVMTPLRSAREPWVLSTR